VKLLKLICRNSSKQAEPIETSDPPMKIYVGGLTEHLADITENDLYSIFPFGEIDYIDLHRDPITGKCKGYAFIQFRRASQARAAITAMNGFNYKGKILRVGEAHESAKNGNESFVTEGDVDEETLHNYQSRQALMMKLSRDTNPLGMNLQMLNSQFSALSPTVETEPSNCILLSNLFDPRQVDLAKEPEFYTETYEDVFEQCSNLGRVEKVWVDQNSLGNVWVKFADNNQQASLQAIEKLNGR
jgi:RNA-binding protein 39